MQSQSRNPERVDNWNKETSKTDPISNLKTNGSINLNTTKWKEEKSLDLQSGYRKDSKRGPAATFLFDVSVSQET
jgi:hypothetical protein